KRLRLDGYDYAQPGMYFVTICTAERRCCLGDVLDGIVSLTALGELIPSEWKSLPQQFPGIQMDDFVVMPNHLDGLIEILEPEIGLPQIVGTFKSRSTSAAHRGGLLVRAKLWQRSYHG